jgi:hypothetical protein
MLIRKIMILLLIFIVTSVIAIAEEHGSSNDPGTNPDANACYEGGTWEGQCDSEVAWQCGWYLIRYDSGMSGLPDWCEWAIAESGIWCQVDLNPNFINWNWDAIGGYDVWYSGGDDAIFDDSWDFNHWQEANPGYPACTWGTTL